MSVALSFVGGTGSFAFLEMICMLKKWFSFWLAVGSHSLRSVLAPLLIRSPCALMRISLNSSINVMGAQIRSYPAFIGRGKGIAA